MKVSALSVVSALAGSCCAANNVTQGSSIDDLKQAAKTIAQDIMKDLDINDPFHVTTVPFSENNTNVFGDAGLLYSTLIDYWQYTGDSAHNDVVAKGILALRGPHNDYSQFIFNASWTEDAGNWGMAAMAAAEHKLPHPGKDQGPSWLELAENIFNRFVSRWDSKYCGGVLAEYAEPKDEHPYGPLLDVSMTTGSLFNLGARLARFTGNATYADWANKAWDHMQSSGLIGKDYWINWGHVERGTNCSNINEFELGHTTALLAMGAAALFDSKHDADKWRPHIQQLVSRGLFVFMHDKLLVDNNCGAEIAPGGCSELRRRSMARFVPWFAATAQMAPFVYDQMLPSLQYSGRKAALHCVDVGNATHSDCFLVEEDYDYRRIFGSVEKIAALGVVSAALVTNDTKPATGSEDKSKSDKSGGGQVTVTAGLMVLALLVTL